MARFAARTAVAIGGLLAFVWLPAASGIADASTFREPDCRVSVDNPHYSSGAKGIISKGRYTCSSGISGSIEDVRVSLFTGCRDTLPATKPITRFDCNKITTETYSRVVGRSGSTTTVYVPKSGKAGHPNKSGYHRAYIEWEYPGSNTEYRTASQQVSGVL